MWSKYLQTAKITWNERLEYRLSFVLWRVRVVLQVLVVYFVWLAVFTNRSQVFGYTQSMMLTYILLSSLIRSVVFATTTMEIHSLINQGTLSFFLIKPVRFFRYYMARDAADKLLNIIFSVGEVALIIAVFAPPVFIQSDVWAIFRSLLATGLGLGLYFYFSIFLSLLGFWTPDVWAPRFLSFVIMEFFAGSLFPLDILPQALYNISRAFPFYYMLYLPLKTYLAKNPEDFTADMIIGIIWLVLLNLAARFIWQRGVRSFSAEGR